MSKFEQETQNLGSPVGISIKNLKKSFGEHHVLNDVTIDVQPSESLVILGQSGTGKSVLLRCIMGLEEPDSGSIQLNGHELLDQNTSIQNKLRAYMGIVFQGSALFDSMTIQENIIFGLKARYRLERLRSAIPLGKETAAHRVTKNKHELEEEAAELLKLVGLQPEQVVNLYPSEISGGMQRRVSIARTMSTVPRIILLDEPTAGLDPIATTIIDDLIIKSHQKLKATMITITHDITSAMNIATRIAMLHEGRVVWIGTPAELKKSKDPIVKQFVSGSLDGPIKTREGN